MPANPIHLGERVLARREALGISQLEVWRTGGPSNTKLTEIENGRLAKLTPSTARKLDAGLLWESGSARAVWEGGEPTPLGGGRRDVGWLRQQIDQAEISAALRGQLLDVLDGRRGVRGA